MDNKLKIINYLGKNKQSFTMNELSKILNIPYATFYREINKMKNLLKINVIGNSKIISLDNEPILKSYLAISSEEEKIIFLKNQPLINLISKELNTNDVIILFGSYAKNKQTNNSDIDLIILNKDGKKSISLNKLETLLNKEINPMFFSYNEFKLMIDNNEENVGKQALKSHIILNNPQKFWEVIFE
ncbi:MAG: nucleotidyltransferase domain-containing protein [Candidatus Nanoarchaeia archaeon]|nr:nucleotidyltransferase domain-containing protein [Candidatus Nanoarchaeia archaeon]